ncbi:MAG: hypothetical protein Q8R31_01610, partial [Candidatus Omnitrophota bacterium]|nr:hypothetical protein [Candidatus Omnitrophota bacterium]
MRKCMMILVTIGLFILGFERECFANEFVWQNISREHTDLRAVLVNPDNPSIIYVGANNGIFKTEDAGANWRNILSVKGQNRSVNFLLLDPQDKNSLYAATGNGLFYSFNQGKSWKRIFQGKNYLENECTTIAVSPAIIYVGTKGGLFISKDRGRSWYKEKGKLGSSNILAIAYNKIEPRCIYVACIDGVFRTVDAGQAWERIFVAHSTEDGFETEEEAEVRDEEENASNMRYLTIDPNNSNYLYLATSRGVYKSQDRAKTWELVPSYGLLSQDVRFLLVSNKSYLYAVTKSGVFEYKGNRWQELSFGLAAVEVRFLALDK